MDRRFFLKGCVSLAALAVFGRIAWAEDQPQIGQPITGNKIEIEHTETEWKSLLTPEQYWVLRLRGTETPYSSPLEKEHRKGTFFCAGCNLPLFSSATKFDSGTGWPSFYAPLPDAVATMVDHELGFARTEVHCRRCGGHLGHVFDDGPQPTGLRYCMNGVAMKFQPDAS
jgi:peptide-methionine (R)-S-oxide reductase